MYQIFIRLAISATIATVAIPIATNLSFAAEPTLSEILSGKTIPTTVKLKELTPEWRTLATNGQFELGSSIQSLFTSFTGMSLYGSYYTKGQTISLAGESYIVAYSLQDKPEKITGEIPLGLSLLNMKTIGSLTNIRSFNLVTETALLEKQLQNAAMLNPPKPKQPEVKPDAETPVPAKPKPKRTRRKTVNL
jgi:hypothetical protein